MKTIEKLGNRRKVVCDKMNSLVTPLLLVRYCKTYNPCNIN